MEKIADTIETIVAYSHITDVRIEGIDTIIVKYKTIVDGTKKKTYDVLDHRKNEVCTLLTIYLKFGKGFKIPK